MIPSNEFKNLTAVEILDYATQLLSAFNELNVSPLDVQKILDIVRYVNEISKIQKQ